MNINFTKAYFPKIDKEIPLEDCFLLAICNIGPDVAKGLNFAVIYDEKYQKDIDPLFSKNKLKASNIMGLDEPFIIELIDEENGYRIPIESWECNIPGQGAGFDDTKDFGYDKVTGCLFGYLNINMLKVKNKKIKDILNEKGNRKI